MTSADEAWEDMKSPEAAKMKAYRRRVKWILTGSERDENLSARVALTVVKAKQHSKHRPSAGVGSNALDISRSQIDQSGAGFHQECIAQQKEPSSHVHR